jgi:hypothetical protein
MMSGLFIPDPDPNFLPIPDPGSRGSKRHLDPGSATLVVHSPGFVQPEKAAAVGGRLRIESDESEYDSEMDDFIDDTEPTVDISKEIRSIFG